jgi:hypothetical protein
VAERLTNRAHLVPEEAKQVCPTTTHRLVGEGALLVDIGERAEGARTAFGDLQHHGFKRVSNMQDGLLKGMRKGFPVIRVRHGTPEASALSCCGGAAPQKPSTGCR